MRSHPFSSLPRYAENSARDKDESEQFSAGLPARLWCEPRRRRTRLFSHRKCRWSILFASSCSTIIRTCSEQVCRTRKKQVRMSDLQVTSQRFSLTFSLTCLLFWTGRMVWATNTWAVGLARRCRRRNESPLSVFLVLKKWTKKYFSFSFSNVYTYFFALFVQLPFSPLFRACSSWLPLPLASVLLSPSSQPPIDRVSPNVAKKLVMKPILLNRPCGLSD